MHNLFRKNENIRQFARSFKMLLIRRIKGLKNVSKTFYCSSSSTIAQDLIAGEYSFINHHCDICPRVRIGNYTILGPYVMITGDDHIFNCVGVPIYFSGRPKLRETIIADDVWVGARAIILTGTAIGRGAIVAAGSVITKTVNPYEIVAGVPARKIRDRFSPDEIIKHNQILDKKPKKRWDYPHPLNQS
jgi:acetyltransferase-like isoleucine patch superfamily enzyme